MPGVVQGTASRSNNDSRNEANLWCWSSSEPGRVEAWASEWRPPHCWSVLLQCVTTAEISRANPPQAHGYLYDSKCKRSADKQAFSGLFFFCLTGVSRTDDEDDEKLKSWRSPASWVTFEERWKTLWSVFAIIWLILFVCCFFLSWKAVNLAAAAALFFPRMEGNADRMTSQWQEHQRECQVGFFKFLTAQKKIGFGWRRKKISEKAVGFIYFFFWGLISVEPF